MELRRVLVVDDEEGVRRMITVLLQKEGYTVSGAASGAGTLELLARESFDLVLSDVRMPGMDGLDLLARIRALYPETTVIVMSAFGTVDLAVEAMKQGAYDYISKPFKPDEILLTLRKAQERERLRRENISLRRQIEERDAPLTKTAQSEAMRKVMATAAKVAEYRSSVLITGESGTGKEVLARSIHRASPWGEGPFVAINCGAIPAALLESELFGHVRGAFTDAVKDKRGLLEEAHGGTLFLDEIGDLPLEMQVKLLRVLQEGEFRRVGDNRPLRVETRIIAATAKDLARAAREGSFREDLFYRLNVVPIHIPPLRERREDIPPLAESLLESISLRLPGGRRTLSPGAAKLLLRYAWPGNVREMENLLERASILSGKKILEDDDLLPHLGQAARGTGGEGETPSGDLSIKKATADLERRLILQALLQTRYNRTQAARLLEISHRALLYKIKDYGIPLPGKS